MILSSDRTSKPFTLYIISFDVLTTSAGAAGITGAAGTAGAAGAAGTAEADGTDGADGTGAEDAAFS